MTSLLPLLITLLPLAPIAAQSARGAGDTLRYEIRGELPLWSQAVSERLTFPLAWGNAKQRNFKKWRRSAREVLMQCLQTAPPTAPFDAVVVDREQRDGYEARKIEFNVSALSRIPAYLLVPDSPGPHPAIVMLHDHGAKFSIGKEKLVRPFGVPDSVRLDAEAWIEKCYDGEWVADRFAREGYVVLVADALFWGERGRKEGVNYAKQETLAANLLQLGMSWTGVITHDDMQCAELLATLPEVDPDRIGALGFSLGAHRAWMLAAATDRIKAHAAVCWMNTTPYLTAYRNNQTRGQSAYSMLVPGLRNYLDYPHTAAIACPKPALYFAGSRDKLFPVAGVEDAFKTIGDTYASQGVADRLTTRIWDEKHFFSRAMQDETVRFFDAWLKKR
jgi:dienelactone hydrolase